MSADGPPFPAADVIARWWDELAPHDPARLWVARLTLHHLDAAVTVRRSATANPVLRYLLRAIERGADRLDALHLGPALPPLLRQLRDLGLAIDGPGGWSLTDAGRSAAGNGEYAAAMSERRAFTFVDAGEPEFVTLARPLPAAPADVPPLGVVALRAFVGRPGFPADVADVVEPTDLGSVPVDRPEAFTAAVIETDQGLCVFDVRPETWTLAADGPAFSLAADGPTAAFLRAADDLERWREQWVAFGERVGLADVVCERCELRRDGHRLLVRPPADWPGRLPPAGWLLAGSGPVRAAAFVESA